MHAKKTELEVHQALFVESGNDIVSRAVSSQVPSAHGGLTSVFGMGTGGALQPLSPEIICGASVNFSSFASAPDSPSDFASLRTLKTAQGPAILTRYLSHFAFRFRSTASRFSSSSALLFACLRSSPRPISISKLPCYHAFTADLSTLSSARGLTSLRYGSLLLEVGFTLRCLQRLSRPYFASLLCRWHDNSCTSGTFTPVLSY